MTIYSLKYSFPNLEPIHCSMSSILTVVSWPAYRFLRRQAKWSRTPISLRIFHSHVWPKTERKKKNLNPETFSSLEILILFETKREKISQLTNVIKTLLTLENINKNNKINLSSLQFLSLKHSLWTHNLPPPYINNQWHSIEEQNYLLVSSLIFKCRF